MREVAQRRKKLIIDFILINKNERQKMKDVKVQRGPEIYSENTRHKVIKK